MTGDNTSNNFELNGKSYHVDSILIVSNKSEFSNLISSFFTDSLFKHLETINPEQLTEGNYDIFPDLIVCDIDNIKKNELKSLRDLNMKFWGVPSIYFSDNMTPSQFQKNSIYGDKLIVAKPTQALLINAINKIEKQYNYSKKVLIISKKIKFKVYGEVVKISETEMELVTPIKQIRSNKCYLISDLFEKFKIKLSELLVVRDSKFSLEEKMFITLLYVPYTTESLLRFIRKLRG